MLTTIHNCLEVNLQNEYFKEKLTEFYKENKRLKEQIKEISEQNEKFKKKSNEIGIQTSDESANGTSKEYVKCKSFEPVTRCSVCDRKRTSETKTQTNDNEAFNKQNKKSYVKLCEMQHTLLKKYEDEVNSNAVKQDLINHMKLELDSLESKNNELEKELSELKTQLDSFADLDTKHKRLILDNESLKLKLKRYKSDLKCFDKSFFDSLEELKRKYDESIQLNKYYEKLLYEFNKTSLETNFTKKVTFEQDNYSDDDVASSSLNETLNYQNLIEQLND